MIEIIIILFTHFVADFVLQTDKQAVGKSTSNYWLTLHVLTYTAGIFIGGVAISNVQFAMEWALLNGVIHWGQDWITSRINSKLWKAEQRHWFFVSIGFDQFLHYCFLLLTYNYLTK